MDDEATSAEKRLLSKCVRRDREMARIFHRECKIHAAACKIYGREPRLAALDGIPDPLMPPEKYLDPSAKSEWAAVADAVCGGRRKFICGTATIFSNSRKNSENAKGKAKSRRDGGVPGYGKIFYGENENRHSPRRLRRGNTGIQALSIAPPAGGTAMRRKGAPPCGKYPQRQFRLVPPVR